MDWRWLDLDDRVQIVVDGVTGVGKSSLAGILAEELGLSLYEEIFEDKNELLYKFFKDRCKWCFPMQLNFLSNRFKQYKLASRQGLVVLDRSIFSDLIFARMYREIGYLTPEEFDVYQSIYENMMENLAPPVLTVYLRATVGEVVRRIQKRGRQEELNVETEYWRQLHNFYEDHYGTYSIGELLILDVSELDFVNCSQDRERIIGTIRECWLEVK